MTVRMGYATFLNGSSPGDATEVAAETDLSGQVVAHLESRRATVQERTQADATLHAIVEGLEAAIGKRFFASLVQRLL
jgi:hypothetical protein